MLDGAELGLGRYAGLDGSRLGRVSMDVRRQSGHSLDGDRSVRGNTVKGRIIRGVLDGPDYLFFKAVYLDVYSLAELMLGLDFADKNRLPILAAHRAELWLSRRKGVPSPA
ncbi:acetylxylan esterase [Streptococcus panodentis]|uniref:acetylxylan esterase n=1 Tax=Streptococcus panodentis TaxID=1581472 RepID=UPI001FD8F6C8|nr:acetylxylan esterase [Streptococcus panodentis]